MSLHILPGYELEQPEEVLLLVNGSACLQSSVECVSTGYDGEAPAATNSRSPEVEHLEQALSGMHLTKEQNSGFLRLVLKQASTPKFELIVVVEEDIPMQCDDEMTVLAQGLGTLEFEQSNAITQELANRRLLGLVPVTVDVELLINRNGLHVNGAKAVRA